MSIVSQGQLLEHVTPEAWRAALEQVAAKRRLALPPELERPILEREAARRGLPAYNTLESFVRARHPVLLDHAYMRRQISVAQRVVDGELRRVLVLMPTQYGKALADDTPIATPRGWTTMGALQVGDEVFGADGEPTAVIAVPFRGVEPTYLVSAEGGGTVRAGSDHRWEICLPDGSRVVRTTEDLATRGVPWGYTRLRPYGDGTREVVNERVLCARIPTASALVLPQADLPIAPYAFGAWLGDGASAGASITIAHADAPEMIASFCADGWELQMSRSGQKENCAAYAIVGPGGKWDKRNGFTVILRRMGALRNKHIPDAYLFASREQRLALLQGLIDTDGAVCRHSGRVFFNNTNKRLIDGVCTLVASLGAKAIVRERHAMLYGRDCGPCWDVAFYMLDAARLTRKAERIRVGYRVATQKAGRALTFTKTDPCPVTCITVAHPSGLFLAGKQLMVTHNSEVWSRITPAYYLLQNPSRTVALTSYGADLAWEHSSAARDYYSDGGGRFKEGSPKGAMRNWRTNRIRGASGGMWATGIGGPSLGRGYHLGIVDDPIDPLQVVSPAYQKRFQNWWPSKWLRGQRPGIAAIVFVMQRLSPSDPVEWLLQREEDPRLAEHWHIVVMDEIRSNEKFGRWKGPLGFPETCTVESDPRPMGALLAPRFRRRPEVEKMQATAGPIVAGAQRQQRPMMPTGDFWKEKWFREYTVLPSEAYNGGWDWDTAYSEEEKNAATAGVKTFRGPGKDDEFAIYFDDVWWDWVEFPALIQRLMHSAGPHYVEKKASGKSAAQVLRGYKIPTEEVEVYGSKLARASAAQPAVSAGRIYVRKEIRSLLLSGEGQGLLRVTAEALMEGTGGLDVNDSSVQAIHRHLKLGAKKRGRVAVV